MKKRHQILSLALIYILFPASFVVAGPAPGDEAARNFVATLNDVILFPLIGLLTAVAFFVFIWGCFDYIRGANNPSAREQGVKHITYGIIGLVVMISAWAILNIAAATFGLDDELDDLSGYETELVVPLA